MAIRTAVLTVPFANSSPFIQSLDPGLVKSCLLKLKEHFTDPRTRNETYFDGHLTRAHFHNLQNQDNNAGELLLNYLLNEKGYRIVGFTTQHGEHGTLYSAVYSLQKETNE